MSIDNRHSSIDEMLSQAALSLKVASNMILPKARL